MNSAGSVDTGVLAFTEAGTKRRASLHVVEGKASLDAMNPGGIEVMEADLGTFRERLIGENHTLKRALTDPRLFAGIVYAENETNYCARCQTGGKLLADRALSRLLKKSWPRSIDELD